MTRTMTAVAALVIGACATALAADDPPEAAVCKPVVREVQDSATVTGRVEAAESVSLRPRVTAYVERVHFRDGAAVKKGDVMFVLESAVQRAALARARAVLDLAKATLARAEAETARARKLFESNVISREEVDKAAAAVAEAKASLAAADAAARSAELDLAFCTIASPIDGRVGRAMATPGNLVKADETLLATVVSAAVRVTFRLNEVDFARLTGSGLLKTEGGLKVGVGIAQGDDFALKAAVEFVDNQFDVETATVRVRAVPAEADVPLLPGRGVIVRVPLDKPRKALMVPAKAFAPDLYVVAADGGVRQARAAAGVQVGHLVEVRAGLKEGERVVADGTDFDPRRKYRWKEVPAE